MTLRSTTILILLLGAFATNASPTVFSRDGWGWWIDEGGAASRGRGGAGIAASGYGASGSINPASIAGADLSYGFASYAGETAEVRGAGGEYRQRQDLIPEFGGVVVLPGGVRAGLLLRALTDASFERTENLSDDPLATDRHITKGSGGWNRVQATIAGPALDGRLHWGVGLGPTFGTVKEDHDYDFMPGHGNDIRIQLAGRMRSAWSASAGAIALPDPRIRAGASFSLPGSSRLTQEVRVIEGTSLYRSTRGTMETPGQWAVGIWGQPHPRLAVFADYGKTLWGDVGIRSESGAATVTPYQDANRWGAGIELRSPLGSSGPPRWVLRSGYSEAVSYVRSIEGEKIVERSLSLGARARAGKSRAAVDLALEMGKRGDRGTLGVEEQFVRLTLGVVYSSVQRDY